MLGTVGEVNELLRVACDEAGAPSSVAVVGGASGIAATQRISHIVVVDGATPSAIANGQELAVPAGGGEPDLGPDIGVRSRAELNGDATEAWKMGKRVRTSGRRERACLDGHRFDDGYRRRGGF